MKIKKMQILFYILHSMVMASIYGLFTFFVIYRGLAGENMLLAYIWNIISILAFLALNKLANYILLSKELVITKETYFTVMLTHSFSLISFKTVLYLFYTVILILSRVALLEPQLLDQSFRGFVLSIEYCLILVVALDKFFEHLTKDDKRIKRITAKFDKFERLTRLVRVRGKRGNP